MSRERRSTEFFEDTSSPSTKQPDAKFDLSQGTGVKLSNLSTWVVGNRGGAADVLETALEPLHRAVFGRPGKQMERRAALADYCGFPPSMGAIMKSKVVSWKKDQLRALVQALGVNAHVSVPLGELAESVLKFLQSPSEGKKATNEKPPKTAPQKRAAEPTAADVEPPKKKQKVEAPVVAKKQKVETPAAAKPAPKVTSVAKSAPGKKSLHDDTIRVAVYSRVLVMSPEERSNIGIKTFRSEIEKQYSLEEGSLKDKVDIIRDTAAVCVKAVRDAETRGAATALQTEDTKPTEPAAEVAEPEPVAEAAVVPTVEVAAPAPVADEPTCAVAALGDEPVAPVEAE